MRTLTSAVLVMEAIVVGLAIPVVLVVGDQPAGVWFLAAVAVACLILPAFYGRPFFEPVGWLLQGAAIASGGFVPMMLGLGAVFAALWWAALHFGKKVEHQRPSMPNPPERS